MLLCDKCLVKFTNQKVYNEHVENLHKVDFDALFIHFIKKYEKGTYTDYEMKFTSEQRSKMKTLEQLSERLKVEVTKIANLIILPSYLSIKLDLTLTKKDLQTRVSSFYTIRVQGRSIYVHNERSLPVDVEAIIQDLNGKFDTRMNDMAGLTLWGFNSVLLASKRGSVGLRYGLHTRKKQNIPQLTEQRISPYDQHLKMLEKPLPKC
jgi:hypothetical protein